MNMKIFVNKSKGILHYVVSGVLYPMSLKSVCVVCHTDEEVKNKYAGEAEFMPMNKYFREVTPTQLQELINEKTIY